MEINEKEITIHSIRSSGPGGQNVNKVSTAIELRLDIPHSSLPEDLKQRLLCLHDRRISKEGVLVIKSMNHRTRESNLREARNRLNEIMNKALIVKKKRTATGPTRASKKRRLSSKKIRGQLKKDRQRVFLSSD